MTFEESRDEIVREVSAIRNQAALNKALEELRTEANIRINFDALANVRIDHQAKGQAL
jgi:hypothetical protein